MIGDHRAFVEAAASDGERDSRWGATARCRHCGRQTDEAGQIIVSELVANAVEHARPTLELVVRLHDRVQIEVAGGSPDPPVPADPQRPASCRPSAATA
jgi:hypothetical protein